MKKKKYLKLLICLIVFVLLIALYVGIKKQGLKKEENEESSFIKVTALNTEDITGISFYIGDEQVSFAKKDATWLMEEEESFPLDDSKIVSILEGVATLNASRKLENISDLSEFGLESPLNTITLTGSDGIITTIEIGEKNTTTNNTYISLNHEKNTIYTVSTDFTVLLPESKRDLGGGETFPAIDSSNITSITIEGQNKKVALEVSDDVWYVMDEQGNRYSADHTSVSAVETAITGCSYEQLVDYKGENMKPYGLGQPAATICICYREEQEQTDDGEVSAGESVYEEKKIVLKVGDKDERGNYYVNVDGSKEVHTIAAESLETMLEKEAQDYWNLEISSIAEESVKGLTVTYEDKTTDLKRNVIETTDDDGNLSSDTIYTLDGIEIDGSVFSQFYNKVTSLSAQSKSKELTTGRMADMKIVFHMNDDSDKEVTYTSYDENFYLAKDTEGRYGLVGKMAIRELFTAFESMQ